MAWQPRPRPAWVSGFNAYASPDVIPLDEASLFDAACAATGLDDFGDDGWRVGFSTFVRSLVHEANLHLLGRLMARNEIVRSLINRLQITDALRRHPEITSAPIETPMLVTGTGRSGTSILHELLAQDPHHRVARTWELLHPWPAPESATYRTDPRIAVADAEYTFWHEIAPEYQSMHENGGDVPNEDPLADMLEFASDHFMGSYEVPTYSLWLARLDRAPVFRAHRRFFQLLQWRHPGQRWVFKSPSYLSQLPTFFSEYPDGYVVITHRDPVKVLPSLVDLMATLRWMHSDVVDVDALVPAVVRGTAMTFDLITQARDDGRLPDKRIIDVRYSDFVADPWAVIRYVYERTETTLTADAEQHMRDYLAARPQGRHGRHEYNVSDTGFGADEIRSLFAGYLDRYDIPTEV